jgi:hypothetical protein
MRRLFQCQATIIHSYKIIVEDGQTPEDVAYACLDEVVDDSGRPRPKDLIVREVKITKDLQEMEAVYCDSSSSFNGFLISDLIEEHFPEPEEELPS